MSHQRFQKVPTECFGPHRLETNRATADNVFNHRKLCRSIWSSRFLHIFFIAVQTVPCEARRHARTLGVIKRTAMIVLEEGLVSLRRDRNHIMTARRQNYFGTRAF